MSELPLWRKLWIWATWDQILDSAPTTIAGTASRSSSAEFSRSVTAASELLDFLIKEGLRPIRDQIIDDIEAAREIAQNGTPSKEDHAKLLKAYRDLTLVPRITIVSARVPPLTFWSLESAWPGFLIWTSVLPSIGLALLAAVLDDWHWYWPVAYFSLSVFVISGLYVFSGTVTNDKLNQIIRFCYIFTGFALVASLLPFALPNLVSKLDSDAPVGILKGCVGVTATTKDAYPPEVRCEHSSVQWVARLGGTVGVMRSKPDSATPAQRPGAEPTPTAPSPGEKASAPPVQPPGAGATPTVPSPGEKASAPPVQPPGAGATPTVPSPSDKASTPPVQPPKAEEMINGGLVVPLYVLVLALFGGAISMTRRVPEYQRRAMDSQDSLSNSEARENLVFQIMQVATAPLIAVTTYYIIFPDTPLKSVVVGFGSGFASEPILLMIRALVDKLKPAVSAPSPNASNAISVTITPPSAIVPPRNSMQFAAGVTGAANTQVIWLLDPPDASAGIISQTGLYVAPDTIPTKGVTVTARSVADSMKFATASVKIEPIVTVTPTSETLGPGKSREFKAEVFGLSDTEVNWSIVPETDGGQISNGSYTAPSVCASTRTVSIVARSKADASRFGSAKVVLVP